MNVHSVYEPMLRHFRTRRMATFQKDFEITRETRILDVGGTEFIWSLMSVRPDLTLLNLNAPTRKQHAQWIMGDGRQLPFQDSSFDIVFSNSVIEHLGSWENQQLFAHEIARVGYRYYVETPSKWFPVEPHLLTPMIHYLPSRMQVKLFRNFTIWGWLTRPTRDQCESLGRELRLLDRKEMMLLFPDADVRTEKFVGLTKSLVAQRRNEGQRKDAKGTSV